MGLCTRYDIPVGTEISPDGKETISIHFREVSCPVRTGPFNRDLVTDALTSKSDGYHLQLWRNGNWVCWNKRKDYWQSLFGGKRPGTASMEELLGLIRARKDVHAATLAGRQTTISVYLHNVVVETPPKRPELIPRSRIRWRRVSTRDGDQTSSRKSKAEAKHRLSNQRDSVVSGQCSVSVLATGGSGEHGVALGWVLRGRVRTRKYGFRKSFLARYVLLSFLDS